ncbi:MAG: 4a-hydroxytetrahydrobiopterin dehydratase [Candidatus Micrarchaeaceae archaeon]
MKTIIVVTGTPGVGKTTLAKKLSKRIGAVYVNSLDLAKASNAIIGKDDALIVSIKKLKKGAEKIAKKENSLVFDGHLFCEMHIKGSKVIVLREHIKELERRLRRRKYGPNKIKSNLICEALDYCGEAARMHYKVVHEAMSGIDADEALNILRLKKSNYIDLSNEIMDISGSVCMKGKEIESLKGEGWYVKRNKLMVDYELKDFSEAMKFVNKVAKIAELMDHHPDIRISYNKLHFELFTHSENRLTWRDISLAKEITKAYKMLNGKA